MKFIDKFIGLHLSHFKKTSNINKLYHIVLKSIVDKGFDINFIIENKNKYSRLHNFLITENRNNIINDIL